jgi:type 2 lantibiotic biosynthesis protein LanM
MGLFDRIESWHHAGRPRVGGVDRSAANAFVERWKSVVAAGDQNLFDVRLQWDGLTASDAADALTWVAADPRSAARSAPDRGWSDHLELIFEEGLPLVDDDVTRRIRDWAVEDGIPFAELWTPWVAEAGAAVSRHAAVCEGSIAAGAVDSLLRHLLRQLSDLASPAAYEQFRRQRSTEVPALGAGAETGFYEAWIGRQLDSGMAPLFDEYPVLARQLHVVLTTWKISTGELFDRFQVDRPRLEEWLGAGGPPGPVVEIEAGLSDRHHRGRRVAILVFDSGVRVVYKPRSLALESAYASFVEWLIGQGLAFEPTVPRLIDRTDYGWMEWMGPVVFDRAEDVSSWFSAAGAVLCVTHLLRASDLHFDNVLVGPDSPVLVDLETLMHPEPAVGDAERVGGTAAARVAGWMRASFQSTGMLSFLLPGPDGAVIDIGGLCGTGGHALADETTEWEGLASDGLRMIGRRATARIRRNVPTVDGRPASVAEHLVELRNGFEAAYRLVLGLRDRITGADSLMNGFYHARSRVLLRPTEQYAKVLQLSASPACQRDGAAVSLVIEALHRGAIRLGPRPAHWDLAEWERRDLEALDIPRWTVRVENGAFEAPDGKPVEGVIAGSGREAFERRIRGMCEDDLHRQLHLMALTLESEHDAGDHDISEVVEPLTRERAVPGGGPSEDVLLSEARSIAGELSARAVKGDDGSVIWLDPVHLAPKGRTDRGVSYYLYSGSVGIAVFLAAMDRALPGRGYRDLVEGALLPVVRVLEEPNASALLAGEGLGACHGLGGIVYALTVISDFLHEDGYVEAACAMARYITEERIAGDAALDLEGGAAGAILGLLALDDRASDSVALEVARACGRALLDRQQLADGCGAAWPSREGGMLGGLAHGASGGALAMVRLWRRTGDDAFLESARRALEFENTLYDPFFKNWPLLLRDDAGRVVQTKNMAAWCHGAPGIALARSCVRDVLPIAEAAGALETAVETTLAVDPGAGPDHLCCGTLGRVDVLLTVGAELERPVLRLEAESRAAMVIRLAAGRAGYRLRTGPGPARPGLFRGLAGVGYQMLRLRSPGEVPSVLAFQTVDLGGRAG